MREIGMADNGMTDNRENSSSALDEDDPLMELSRIIGLEPRRETVSRYAPSPRVDPEIETDAVEVPAAQEISDVLQQDLAEELIASLGSDDDFSDSAAVVDDLAPAGLNAADEAEGAAQAGFHPVAADESVPHISMSAPLSMSAPQPGSLEAELESILNPSVSRPAPFSLRPMDDEAEAGTPEADVQLETYEHHALPAQAWEDSNFEEETEPAAGEAHLDAGFDAAPVFEAEAEPEALRAEESDYWRRPASRDGSEAPAGGDFEQAAAPKEPQFDPEELQFEKVPLHGETEEAVAAAPAPEIEPVVDAIAHEARGVEMTGELVVPEFEYAAEERSMATSAIDDGYDGFAPSIPRADGAPPEQAARYTDDDYDQINEAVDELEQERGFSSVGLGSAAAVAAGTLHHGQGRRDFVLDDDDNFGASLDVPNAPMASRNGSGRSYLIAAGLGALALVGGIGAFALTRPGDPSRTAANAPVVLKADPAPVKIVPETPGGKVVPNQDIAVFDNAAGANPPETMQTELVSKTEAPLDLAEKAAPRVVLPGPAKADTAMETETAALAPADSGAKSEERVAEQSADDASLIKTEVASVSPKKVRTMVVKSDGSLEERAAPVAAPAPVEPVMAAPTESAVPAKTVQTSAVLPEEAVGTVAKADETAPAAPEDIAATQAVAAAAPAAEAPPAAAEAKPVVKSVKVKKITQKAAKAEALREVAAANIPLVDGRPSDQPVTIVAKTGKTPQAAEEAAALAPEPAAAGGGYVIQIASAPSPDAAQATYASLNRKFGNVIGGKNMKIQKADIPGKGTFYRVRIAAGSKKEAAALCAKYKSAGGQCLVAR